MVFAAVAGMRVVPNTRRGRHVSPGGKTGLRQGEHREGRADHAVPVFVEGDGVDGIPEPDELPIPSP